MPRKYCASCNQEVNDEHWYWCPDQRYRAGGRWRCKVRREGRFERFRQQKRLHYEKYPEVLKYAVICHKDKDRGFTTMSLGAFRVLVAEPCYYCGLQPCNGVTPIKYDIGHIKSNCVPCCEKCYNLLGDIPFEAKELLKPGLFQIREENLLNDWIVPSRRQKRGKDV